MAERQGDAMSSREHEETIVLETERVTVVRGLNADGETITVVRASKPGGGTPARFALHGMLGCAGYLINREDWGHP